MADRITSIRPGPRPCTLAGRTYPVHEARLCDLAALQAWVDARWVEPDLDAELAASGADPIARDRVLFTAHDRFTQGPPLFDSPEGCVQLIGTREGLTEFFSVALPMAVTDEDIESAVSAVSEGSHEALEWFASVQRAFYGSDPLRLIERLLGVPPERARGESATWAQVIIEVAKEFGWTLDEVMDLSVTAFIACRNAGKPRSGIKVPPNDADKWLDRMNRAMGRTTPTGEV